MCIRYQAYRNITSYFKCLGKQTLRSRPWEIQQSAYAKTKVQISFAVTAKLISAFVFASRIVQFLFYLNLKFQASSSFLCLCRPVCVRPVRKPHCWFSHEAAHLLANERKIMSRNVSGCKTLRKHAHPIYRDFL